jgi:hypothetical protein
MRTGHGHRRHHVHTERPAEFTVAVLAWLRR